MKKLIILITCLALTPIFTSCSGVTGTTEPPKEDLEKMTKAAQEAREKAKEKY